MATPRESEQVSEAARAAPLPRRVVTVTPDAEQEILRALADFERGDYIELTVEQLEHCAATGEWPWPDESRG